MESSSSSLSKKTGSNCQLKQASKRAELNKLYKKVEKVTKRLFQSDRNASTFVPSAQQQVSVQSGSSTSSTNESHPPPRQQYRQMPHQPVMVSPTPPYPVHPGFGTGFPPLPAQPNVPPTYGWALNGIESSSIPSSTAAFSALSLDVGEGDETSGSGFEHLSYPEDVPDYLRPNPTALEIKKNAQSAKLEKVKQRLLDEVTELNMLMNDEAELNRWYEEKYVHILMEDSMTTEELVEDVRKLEEKLRKLREKNPHSGPPPRPPPPRSISQESSFGPWSCARCHTENRSDCYRCRSCRLPSRRFDPAEVSECGCEYCLITTD